MSRAVLGGSRALVVALIGGSRALAFTVVVRSLALVLAFAVVGCGASVPLPAQGDHDADEQVLVPSAPPVPKVEVVPPAPDNARGVVWVSGQWLWSGRRWEWEAGRWETPPEGARYAPPSVRYLDGERIAWLRGKWRPATK